MNKKNDAVLEVFGKRQVFLLLLIMLSSLLAISTAQAQYIYSMSSAGIVEKYMVGASTTSTYPPSPLGGANTFALTSFSTGNVFYTTKGLQFAKYQNGVWITLPNITGMTAPVKIIGAASNIAVAAFDGTRYYSINTTTGVATLMATGVPSSVFTNSLSFLGIYWINSSSNTILNSVGTAVGTSWDMNPAGTLTSGISAFTLSNGGNTTSVTVFAIKSTSPYTLYETPAVPSGGTPPAGTVGGNAPVAMRTLVANSNNSVLYAKPFSGTSIYKYDVGTNIWSIALASGSVTAIASDMTLESIPLQPSATINTTSATCLNTSTNSDGKITLTTFTDATKVGYSEGSTYAGPDFTSATTITGTSNFVVTNTLSNPAVPTEYTVRIYSTATTYIDKTVILNPNTTCGGTCAVPVVTVTTNQATCSGGDYNDDAKLTLTTFDANANVVDFSEGNTYTGAGYSSLTAVSVIGSSNFVISNTLPNPATTKSYTIRIFCDANTYTDKTVTVNPTTCYCMTCGTVSIQKD